MDMEEKLRHIASLIGDPVRAGILWSLLDGRAYTATELSIASETSLPNISMHLAKLVKADLLSVENQGRHKYYRFSRPDVAYAIEAIANLVSTEDTVVSIKNNISPDIKYCRTCYDHLAGEVAILIKEKLVQRKLIIEKEKSFEVTKKGTTWFEALGIHTEALEKQQRSFARTCLDWSERKNHIAGALGAALLDHFLKRDWMRRSNTSRAIIITGKGQQMLYDLLKAEV